MNMEQLQISLENNLDSILKEQNHNIYTKNGIPIYNNNSELMLCTILKSPGVGLFIIDLRLKTIIWGNSTFFILNNIQEKHLGKPILKDLLFRNIHKDDVNYLKNLNIEELMGKDKTSISHTLRYRQKDKSWKYFYFSLLNPEQDYPNASQLKIGIQYNVTNLLSQYSENSSPVNSCFTDNVDFQKLKKLSKREKQIIRLIVRGNTDRAIAKKLGISFYTAETHRKNIIAKLDVKNTASLSFLAGKYGVV